MIPKFRAWDKKNKKIRKVMSLDFYNTRQCEVTLVSDGDVYLRYFEQIELMQSTGLQDKNGVEIFEGDIVATDLERPYLIVEKHRSYFLYNCNDGDDDYYDLMLPLRSYQDSQDYFAEVIGNIYENKDLLEVENE